MPQIAARTPAHPADLHEHRCTISVHGSCACEVCTGIVHAWPPPTPRLPPRATHRHPPRHLEPASVLAHPLRSRLLSALRLGGPATATDLAATLGTNSGATSYHLRKLEAVGLVADTGEGEGKRRLWRAATDFHSYDPSDFAGDEDSETALAGSRATTCATSPTRSSAGSTPPPPGRPPGRTPRQQRRHGAAHRRAAQRHARRDRRGGERYRRVGQGNPEAKRIAVYVYVYPVDLDTTPAQ